MRINAYEDIQPVVPARAGFRAGHIVFRDLMTGSEGQPGNYGLQMVEVPDAYSAPRHRHNFEQVRVMLEGSFGFGPGQVQDEGSVGYFCEGTAYTQAGVGKSRTLLLQIGGPSGQGFMSRRQLREGIDALGQRGVFEGGVFSWFDMQRKKHNQDSYEAVWEYVHGRPIAYPEPQYSAPVLLEPSRFVWRAVAGSAGVSVRHLGRFNSHGLGLSQLRLEAGARCRLNADEQVQLLFSLQGNGVLAGQAFGRWTAAELALGEQAELHAEVASECFVFSLPRFDS